jgi:hypothetical protein
MATRPPPSEFEQAKERLRVNARTLAEQAYVLQALTERRTISPEDLDAAFADWQPPTDAQLEVRAAQELVGARDHARHLADLATLAAADLRRGVEKTRAQLEAAGVAVTEQEAEAGRQEAEAERWQAELDALPDHLRDVAPSGQVAPVYAQAAEARASAAGAAAAGDGEG